MSRLILTVVTLYGVGTSRPIEVVQTPTMTCTTVASDEIGQLPLSVAVGNVRVEFTGWKTRDELDTTTPVGFSIETTGPLKWVAQSGTSRGFIGTGTEFLDELALVKPSLPTLSRITFCSGQE